MNNVKHLTDTGSASRIYAVDLTAPVCLVSEQRVAHQESTLLISLRLSAWLVNRDKDLIATTDVHHWLVRVHTQRPRKGLQAKQSESLRAQDSAIQKPDQAKITRLTVYTIIPMH